VVRPSRITIGRPARTLPCKPGVPATHACVVGWKCARRGPRGVAAERPRSEPGCQSFPLCRYGPHSPVQSALRPAHPRGAVAAPGEPSGHHRARDHSQEGATGHAAPAPAARPRASARPAGPDDPQLLQRSRHRPIPRALRRQTTARPSVHLCAGIGGSMRARARREPPPPSPGRGPGPVLSSEASAPVPEPLPSRKSPRRPPETSHARLRAERSGQGYPAGYACARGLPEKAS
jgi:hypothetical protein